MNKAIRRRMHFRTTAVLAAAGAMFGGLATAATSTVEAGASQALTLTMEGSPENTISQSFNPFLPTVAAYAMGATSFIYEPLIQFDRAAPPKYYPWLATSFRWSKGGKSITFTIRRGVKWSDGVPLTPADVVFTYDLVKKNPAINSGGLDLSRVVTSGDTVTLDFPTSQYTNIEQIANVPIVPEHIWSKVGDPATYSDPEPIGSGPYVLSSFTPQGFVLVANPEYWQKGEPKIQRVDFPDYSTNTAALNALLSGQVQWEGNFIPNLQKIYVRTDPKYHHYWIPSDGADNILLPNLKTWPTDQLAVRQAISLAIDRKTIANEGDGGYAKPIASATGMELRTFASWVTPAVRGAKLNSTPRVSAAKDVLVKAGFVMGSDGYFHTKSGRVLSVSISDPSSYTNYAEDAAIMAQDLKAAGIEAKFNAEAVSAWSTDIATGNYQLAVYWSNIGITPYNFYDGWLNSSLATKSATGDFERLDSPAMDAALAKLAGAQTVTQQDAALAPIERFVAANLPVIPIDSGTSQLEYNSTNIVGWPSASDPYEFGGPSVPTDEVVVLHLSPRG